LNVIRSGEGGAGDQEYQYMPGKYTAFIECDKIGRGRGGGPRIPIIQNFCL